MSFEDLLNKTADVYRISTAIDSLKAHTRTRTLHLEGIPVRLRPLTGRERAMSGTTGVDVTHVLYALPGLDISEADEITVDGVTYDVQFVGGDSSGHHLKLELKSRRSPR